MSGVVLAWPDPINCAYAANQPIWGCHDGPAETVKPARVRCSPPRPRPPAWHRMRQMDGRPDVLVGPRFRLPPDPLVGCSPWSEPRLCIAGRWVSGVRASHQLWVSKVLPHRMTVADRRASLRYRISVRLGRLDDCPF